MFESNNSESILVFLNKLEKFVRAKLPDDYRNFMLSYDGVYQSERIKFSFKEVDPETGETFENNSDIHSFNKLEDILVFYENLIDAGVIPEQYLPIADDSCGNEILLCLTPNDNYGKIYFGDHELYELDETHWVLSEIATSFSEFMLMN